MFSLRRSHEPEHPRRDIPARRLQFPRSGGFVESDGRGESADHEQLAQPGAPHLTNYTAAQAVKPNQAFVLGWDAFPGGTAADYIDVDIGTAYGAPNPGLPGALTGTARRSRSPPAPCSQTPTTFRGSDSSIMWAQPTRVTPPRLSCDVYGILVKHHRIGQFGAYQCQLDAWCIQF